MQFDNHMRNEDFVVNVVEYMLATYTEVGEVLNKNYNNERGNERYLYPFFVMSLINKISIENIYAIGPRGWGGEERCDCYLELNDGIRTKCCFNIKGPSSRIYHVEKSNDDVEKLDNMKGKFYIDHGYSVRMHIKGKSRTALQSCIKIVTMYGYDIEIGVLEI